jgi:hypothetical protein
MYVYSADRDGGRHVARGDVACCEAILLVTSVRGDALDDLGATETDQVPS